MIQSSAKIKIGVIGGSGIDDPDILKDSEVLDVDTPYGKPSDKLTAGVIEGRDVIVLARHGKRHTISPTLVPFKANIWALKDLGCTHILATTECGSLREDYKPKDFVFLDQFIDFTSRRELTFFEDFSEKIVHTPMAEPFCRNLRNVLADAAVDSGLSFHKQGAIVIVEGPRFSTRAESRMFRGFGADLINMSTVPEAALAREIGVCYASIAMVTDYDCWKDGEEAVTLEMVMKTMGENAENAKKLLLKTIPKIDFLGCGCCK